MHLNYLKKLRDTILSPLLSPGVLGKPAIFAVDDVPANKFDGVAWWEFLVFGVDLVEAFFVDEEIAVDGNDWEDWSVVVDLLFDVLLVGGHAVVGDFEFFAFWGFLLALFGGVDLVRERVAGFIY